MSTELFLVRHGQVEAAWRDRIYGCLDVPLSDAGRKEARRAALYLESEPIEAIVSSGLSRTRYGATWLAKDRQLEVTPDADLREIERGDWAGLSFDQLEALEPGAMAAWRLAPWERGAPGGESMGDLALRVWPALDRLAKQHSGQKVAVVVHRHVIHAALSKALGRDEAMQAEIPTGSIFALDWAADGPSKLNWSKLF